MKSVRKNPEFEVVWLTWAKKQSSIQHIFWWRPYEIKWKSLWTDHVIGWIMNEGSINQIIFCLKI